MLPLYTKSPFLFNMLHKKDSSDRYVHLKNAMYCLASILVVYGLSYLLNFLILYDEDLISPIIFESLFVLLIYTSLLYVCNLSYKNFNNSTFRTTTILFIILTPLMLANSIIKCIVITYHYPNYTLASFDLVFGLICWGLFMVSFVIFYKAYQETLPDRINLFLLIYAILFMLSEILYQVSSFVAYLSTSDAVALLSANAIYLKLEFTKALSLLLGAFFAVKATNLQHKLNRDY